MVRLAAELLLLLGLLLLTLHITVLRSSPLPQTNVTVSVDQDTALREVSQEIFFRFFQLGGWGGNLIQTVRGLILVTDGLDKILIGTQWLR